MKKFGRRLKTEDSSFVLSLGTWFFFIAILRFVCKRRSL